MSHRSLPDAELHRHSLTLPVQQYKVIEAIRLTGALSRTALARQLGYSRPSISGIVKDLLAQGILVEGKAVASTGGRRATNLNFSRALGYVFGVDLGATSVDIALANFRGELLQRRALALDVRDGPEPVLATIVQLTQAMIEAHDIPPDKVLSVGIGVPGPVDFAKGVLIMPPIMPGWEHYPIRQTIRARFPAATVVVDNDVNTMAIGELRSGAGQGVENFIFVKIGTGIGAGIIARGMIYRGRDGCAGDIGHIQADRNGPVCHCGNTGCLEAMASGSAIARRAMEAAQAGRSPILSAYLQQADTLTAEYVGMAAQAGDRVAMTIIKESGTLIGSVLASVVNFFNPSLILIGGGVAQIGNQFLANIRRSILSRSLPLATEQLTINYSAMGHDAGITGAIALALEHIFIVAP